MIILEKRLSNIGLLPIIKSLNSDSDYNDVINYIEQDLDDDYYNVLNYHFHDLCYDNYISYLPDLLNDNNRWIIADYADLTFLKHFTGILSPEDHEDLYLDLDLIKNQIKNNPAYFETISEYVYNILDDSFNLRNYDGCNLYNRANDFCFDGEQITDLINTVKKGYLRNNEDLSKYVISFFCLYADLLTM